MSFFAFYDVAPADQNTDERICHVPAGLVLEDHGNNQPHKQYLVTYISPVGNVYNEWRHAEDICMYEISETQHAYVLHCIETLGKRHET